MLSSTITASILTLLAGSTLASPIERSTGTPMITPARAKPPTTVFNAGNSTTSKRNLDERQTVYTCSQSEVTITSTSDVTPGAGDPHQNYYHKQLTQPVTCNQATCAAGSEQGTAISVSFSVDVPIEDWISGGFGVSEEWSSSVTETCQANPGDTVCLWYNTAHTAYSVGKQYSSGDYSNCLNPGSITDPGVMQSPNNNNEGGGYYCVVNGCRNINDGYWEGGCAGGPQGYCGDGSVL